MEEIRTCPNAIDGLHEVVLLQVFVLNDGVHSADPEDALESVYIVAAGTAGVQVLDILLRALFIPHCMISTFLLFAIPSPIFFCPSLFLLVLH